MAYVPFQMASYLYSPLGGNRNATFGILLYYDISLIGVCFQAPGGWL